MKVYYISPSTIPSRSANSIHVVNMCEALTQLGHHVTLFARSKLLNRVDLEKKVQEFYGIDSKDINIVAVRCNTTRGVELGISLRALSRFFKELITLKLPDIIISRNLYAAIFLGFFLRRKIVYEIHAPERGFRKILQGCLVKSGRIPCIVISEALRRIIASLHVKSKNSIIYVMRDAARSEQSLMDETKRRFYRERYLGSYLNLSAYDKFAGYFGHLHPGRGIEIIRGIAAEIPRVAFIVYGGNEKDIIQCREDNKNKNLYFMGHIPPAEVRSAMAMMDMLLMPYQKSVSVGLADVDTAQWMSPMKLFEYMSVGVPIISSDLPVLREVLHDRVNCLLATPDNVSSWIKAVNQLLASRDLAIKIRCRAYEQFRSDYTWYKRADRMVSILMDS
jgi:glycosyltransferase involved in cell wall biosynthesis